VGRAGRDYRLLQASGAAARPGRACRPQTGEVSTVYSTEREPDATLLKACGNRRASVCPTCSATYQADSFQLLAAGFRGGKGVPETVAGHSRLFVTFTAPSFGHVHTRKAQGLLVFPCHPYRQGQKCPHSRRAGCWQRHDADDPRLGEPLCARCYQTGAQVLWNALAGRLWSRTTIYLYRTLAQLAGLTEAELRRLVRISFAKVAEYQKRGAVHFHAIIRLDTATDCGCPACVAPPPSGFTAELLERADQEPPLLDHPGGAAAGPGRLRHPPAPRPYGPAGCLGPARGRPGRDRRRLMDLPGLWLPDDRGGVAGRLGRGPGSGRAPGSQRGTAEHNGGRMTANRYGMEAR
jgi:hypothetical protein